MTMTISDFLSPASVFADFRAADKRQLLRDLAQVAATALQMPAETIATELIKREKSSGAPAWAAGSPSRTRGLPR
jgi:mannitol/fructose-specific phosphotransferase system IIA component (Ntr-type)